MDCRLWEQRNGSPYPFPLTHSEGSANTRAHVFPHTFTHPNIDNE